MSSSGHHVKPKNIFQVVRSFTVWRFTHHHLVSLQSGVENGLT